MPAPLSIVIPTLNAADALPGCLAPLMEGLQAGLLREVIVSDGGSTDASVQMAEAAGAEVITGAKGRGGQLARGMAGSRAPWRLALHADTHLPEGWTQAIRHHMDTAPGEAGYFRLAFRSKAPMARVVAGWANRRSAWFGLPYGDQGLLLPATLYEAIGGYPDVPLMEDVLIVRALKGRLRPMGATVQTSADRYEAEGWLRRGARNWGLMARFAMGAAPEDLARRYASNCKR